MPITHELAAGSSGRLAIWETTESEDELKALLPPEFLDEEKLRGFAYEHRRKQWLASRILLQHLAPGASIAHDESGKPFLQNASGHISISHSHEHIAMIRDGQATGIDIERVRPKIERIAGKFLKDEELVHALRAPQPERLHAYWCLKEATYKVYGRKGVSLKTNIFVNDFTYAAQGEADCILEHEGNRLECHLQYQLLGGFMLAFVVHDA